MTTIEEIAAAIEAWRVADDNARQAEKRAAEASLSGLQTLSPRATDEMVGDARLLRSLANDRLARVLYLMNIPAGTVPASLRLRSR